MQKVTAPEKRRNTTKDLKIWFLGTIFLILMAASWL
jgi:hypothetical protein